MPNRTPPQRTQGANVADALARLLAPLVAENWLRHPDGLTLGRALGLDADVDVVEIRAAEHYRRLQDPVGCRMRELQAHAEDTIADLRDFVAACRAERRALEQQLAEQRARHNVRRPSSHPSNRIPSSRPRR